MSVDEYSMPVYLMHANKIFNEGKMCLKFNCIPRTNVCTGDTIVFVVITPRPPPHPQTLHRSHDNLKKSLSDCFHIVYGD